MSSLTWPTPGQDDSRLSLAGTVQWSTSTSLFHTAWPFHRTAAGRSFLKGHSQRAISPRDGGRNSKASSYLVPETEPLLSLSRSSHDFKRRDIGIKTSPLDGRVSKDLQPRFQTIIILLRFLSTCTFIDLPWTKWSMNVKYVTCGFFTPDLE